MTLRNGSLVPVSGSLGRSAPGSAPAAAGQEHLAKPVLSHVGETHREHPFDVQGDRLRALFQHQPMGVAVLDARGIYVDANPAAERMLGWPRAELLGRHVADPCFRTATVNESAMTDHHHPVLLALKERRNIYRSVIGLFDPTAAAMRWLSVDVIVHTAPQCFAPEVFVFFEDHTDKRHADEPMAMNRASDRIVADATERIAALSPREHQVFDALVRGDSNKVVAFELGISERTVEVHRANLMGKLHARSFAAVIRIGVSAEFGHREPPSRA